MQLDPTKTSWDYIKRANAYTKKLVIPVNKSNITSDISKIPYWMKYDERTKFLDKSEMKWYIRTEDGRKKLDEDDPLLNPAFPTFCPKCGNIMKRGEDDRKAYTHTGGCFICHVKESAKDESLAVLHKLVRGLR